MYQIPFCWIFGIILHQLSNCWKPLFFVLPRSNLKCYSTPFLRTGNPNFSFSPKGPESSLSNFTFIPQKINKEVFLIIIQSCQYTIISPLLFTLLFFLLIFYSPYANIGCCCGLQARCTISIFPRKHTHIDTQWQTQLTLREDRSSLSRSS